MARDPNQHLNDEQFLLYADGDVPPELQASLDEHLERCEQCASELEGYFDREGQFTAAEWATRHHDFLRRLEHRIGIGARAVPLPPGSEARVAPIDFDARPPFPVRPDELPALILPSVPDLKPLLVSLSADAASCASAGTERLHGVRKTKHGEFEWRCVRDGNGNWTFSVAVFVPTDPGRELFDGKLCELWREDVMWQPWKSFPLRRELAGTVAGSVEISNRETAELPATLGLGITVPLHAVCLVVDCSHNVTETYLAAVKRSCRQLFTESDFTSRDFLAAIKLALFQFGLDRADAVLSGLSPNVRVLSAGLERLQPGTTAGSLVDVIDRAVRLLSDAPPGVDRSLILLTPAADREQATHALQRAAGHEISVHIIDGTNGDLSPKFSSLIDVIRVK